MHLRGHPRLRLLAFLPLAALLLLLIAPSASAARFLVKVIDAEIAPKKSTFLRWDTGIGKMTLPDPFVVIDIAGQRLTTDVIKDNIHPKWDASKIFELDGKERVYIYVYDKDRSSDDLIGKTEMNFKDFLHSASLSFGKVHALRLQVQALDTPPPVRVEPTPPTPPTPPPPPVRVEPTPPTPPPPPVRVEPTPPTPPPPPVRVEPTPPTPPPPPVRVEPTPPTPPVRVEPPVAPEPRKPEGRPLSPDAPPVAKSALSDEDFCIALQTFRLECLRSSIQSPDDPRSAIVSRMEAAIKARDPLIFKSCERNLQPKKIKASEACLACARNAGCKARGWDVICAKECKDPKDVEIPAVRPSEVPPTPPVERRDEPSTPPTPPTPPVERRDEAPPARLPGIVTALGDLTPEIFCNRLIDHQMVCVKQRLEEMQRDPAQAQRSAMMKAMVERFTASRPSIVQNCVASYAKEQTRRQAQGEPALSSKQLGDCLLCLQQGGCARAAQQQCRALCSPSGGSRRSRPSTPPPTEAPVRPSP